MLERLKSSSTWIIIMFLVIAVQAYIISQKSQTIQQKEERIVKIEQNHALDLDFARNQRRTVVTTIIKPDGEKVKVVEKERTETKVRENVTDKVTTSDATHHEEIMRPLPDWSLGVQTQVVAGRLQFKEVDVGYRLLGPVHGTLGVTNEKQLLLGLRLEF